MLLQSLGYLGASAPDLDEWRRFGTDFLGLQLAGRSDQSLSFRMDQQAQRLEITTDKSAHRHFFGWEVADASALEQIAARVEAAGIAVTAEPGSIADRRMVDALISFDDPAGNRQEVFHGAALTDAAFEPGRAIAGFRTGSLGLGHVVLTVRDMDLMLPFYRDVLGFRISDYVRSPYKGYFLHLNARHHSLALIETRQDAVHHFMVELNSLDDVGHGYDIVLKTPELIGQTLGRHTNDLMTSFYTRTPSGFMVETGWGGLAIDPAKWEAAELKNGPSIWGHERLWLPPAERARAQEVTLRNGKNGLREPLQIPGSSQSASDAND